MKLQQKTKELGKRTIMLKEIAQKDFIVCDHEKIDKPYPVFNLINIQEDLVKSCLNQDEQQNNIGNDNEDHLSNHKITMVGNPGLPIEIINHLIKKEISRAAKKLDLEEVELQAWIDLQAMAPKQTLLALLRLSIEHNLDPLKEEIAIAFYDDSNWQTYITVEGYSKILNNHPEFDGIVFTQSTEITNGIPAWMECAIYRKDRSYPYVVREYFDEVKGKQLIWEKKPRRMLRHRVMQQCARIAIG